MMIAERISSVRKGCPCCAFDLFLPPSPIDTPNPSSHGDSSTAEKDVPMSPQDVINLFCIDGESSQLEDNETFVMVDTHGHSQLERTPDDTYTIKQSPSALGTNFTDISQRVQLKSIACAVEPADWKPTLDLAAKSSSILPGLGIHPWYLGDGLPDGWLQQLEDLLVEHPSAIVGEIGLCKMARWTRQYPQGKAAALAIQRDVFQQQLQLAAKLRRVVSVHCVNQHGVFMSVLQDIIDNATKCGIDPRLALPPAIAMHSFSGTAHHAKELLALERQMTETSPLFYFGFSHTVNWVMNTSVKARTKGREAVRAIPPERLLVESDVHSTQDLLGGTAGAIAYVAWAREQPIIKMVHLTSRNGMNFIKSSSI